MWHQVPLNDAIKVAIDEYACVACEGDSNRAKVRRGRPACWVTGQHHGQRYRITCVSCSTIIMSMNGVLCFKIC